MYDHFRSKSNLKKNTSKVMSSNCKEQTPKDRSSCDTQQKDIVISIILSESTASILELNAPNLQDLISEKSSTSLFSLRALKFFKTEISPRPSGQSLKQLFSGSKYKDLGRVSTEEVYFAKNFDSKNSTESFDGAATDDFEEDYIVADEFFEQPLLMDKYKVYTRPLLSAKTTAHESKIKCVSNNIYVSILESELTITSSGWINFCRICHGGESVANLITPCRCRGSIALAHLQCLEEWLKQSASSRCELCQHHYEIIREPKYGITWSVLVFLTRPGERFKELLFDILGFLIYTPTAIASTYLLMVLCDNIAMRHNLQYSRNFTNHFLAFTAVFGMATIDFTYSSWLVMMFQRHLDAWKEWYQNNCSLRVVLPPRKLRRHNRKVQKNETSISVQLD